MIDSLNKRHKVIFAMWQLAQVNFWPHCQCLLFPKHMSQQLSSHSTNVFLLGLYIHYTSEWLKHYHHFRFCSPLIAQHSEKTMITWLYWNSLWTYITSCFIDWICYNWIPAAESSVVLWVALKLLQWPHFAFSFKCTCDIFSREDVKSKDCSAVISPKCLSQFSYVYYFLMFACSCI